MEGWSDLIRLNFFSTASGCINICSWYLFLKIFLDFKTIIVESLRSISLKISSYINFKKCALKSLLPYCLLIIYEVQMKDKQCSGLNQNICQFSITFLQRKFTKMKPWSALTWWHVQPIPNFQWVSSSLVFHFFCRGFSLSIFSFFGLKKNFSQRKIATK